MRPLPSTRRESIPSSAQPCLHNFHVEQTPIMRQTNRWIYDIPPGKRNQTDFVSYFLCPTNIFCFFYLARNQMIRRKLFVYLICLDLIFRYVNNMSSCFVTCCRYFVDNLNFCSIEGISHARMRGRYKETKFQPVEIVRFVQRTDGIRYRPGFRERIERRSRQVHAVYRRT